ncbi:MAG: acyl-CoA thioesterase [Pseudomonadales bacterium]
MPAPNHTPVFRGSVNRWECDENDHQNVRFFAHKLHQTLHYGLVESGIATQASVADMCRRINSQHMRFIAEARMAVPMTGYFAVIRHDRQSLLASTELRHTATDQVLAHFLVELSGDFSSTPVAIAELPEYAGSRGVSAETFSFKDCSAAELLERGSQIIGEGVVQAEECDAEGYLQNYQYIGRQSDSMPNLFARFETEQRGEGVVGGAVLEYRMNFFQQLRVGDRFQILSGVKAIAEKTQVFVHTLFNVDSGEMVTGSEALAISMDLVARRAIAIPEDKRQRMAALLIKT